MSLGTAEIDCAVSPPLSGAMEDYSIVQGLTSNIVKARTAAELKAQL